VPTGKIFAFNTNKVDSEPLNASIVDIPHIYACEQTLGLSAGTSFNGQKQQRIDINAEALYNEKQENLRVCSSLVLHQMTSVHNRSELGIQDHSNEPSSSKLVPKSCSSSFQDSYITTRVGITIPPSHSNAEDNR
ncbi:hypothetical protein Tco_0279583, partial [Tanacetum coccineum]